jgi:death-on-curing protein
MIYLTIEQLLELHVLVISQTGGSDGLRDLGRLEAVVASQTQNVYDQELYPSTLDKAAAIMRGIIGDHPYVDGNKRTASLASLTFLQLNDFNFSFKQGEIEDFAVIAAVDHLDIPAIAAWLAAHTG